MNKRLLQIVFLEILVVSAINAQIFEKAKLSDDRANSIIELSKKAIYQGIKVENVKSIYLKTSEVRAIESIIQMEEDPTPRETKSRQMSESSISLEVPDKINQNVFSYDEAKNPTENYSSIKSFINGEKFSLTVDTIIDGKAFDINSFLNMPFLSDKDKKQMREAMEKSKPTKESIQKEISEQLYAILLNALWGGDKIFVYIGKAEAADARADILEIASNTERQTRFFFDEKTHLLLMITDEISKAGMSAKTTQYFSDYQLVDGLMIAKKINAETESSGSQEMEIMGKNTKFSTKAKTITETIVKDFKINPTFKPETFAVKESK